MVTIEQQRRLTELQPETFRLFSDGLFTFDHEGTRLQVVSVEQHRDQYPNVRNEACMVWWMLSDMREQYIALRDLRDEDKSPGSFDLPEWKPLYLFSEYATLDEMTEENIVNAYIAWQESRMPKLTANAPALER
jgi:hypothetical protein